jgi:hypothetical protein
VVATGCPKKKPRLFAGGFANNPFNAFGQPVPIVTDNFLGPFTWTTTSRNVGAAGTVTSTAQALCGQK